MSTTASTGTEAPTVKSAQYDRMAPVYETITRLISMGGNTRSQRRFLKYLQGEPRVLTVGCGSIGFNVDLARSKANVTALDISPRMLEAARASIRAAGVEQDIEFVCSDIMRYKPAQPFDIVMANFFLNTFSWSDCQLVLGHLANQTIPGGLLCIADEARGEKLLTRVMQSIFRPALTWIHHAWADHPLHAIYDYRPVLEAMGFRAIEVLRDESDYIVSTTYRKPGGNDDL